MKKIAGLFSLAFLAVSLFFNVNLNSSSQNNADLSSIIATNVVEAECPGPSTQCRYINNPTNYCHKKPKCIPTACWVNCTAPK